MLPITHNLISHNLYNRLSFNTNINFSKNHLSLGSVIPDFYIKYKINRHYISISLDFVVDMIYDLYNDLTKNRISISLFSFKLGIITHYLSDFFCLAHNDLYFRTHLYKHYIYEKNIHSYFENFNNYKESDFTIDFHNKNSIKSYILNFHNEYINEKPSYDNDVYYTLNMIYSLSIHLLENAICENKYVYLAGVSI